MDKQLLLAFGEHLKKLRLRQSFSQEKLANKAGLDRSYVGGVERGERNVSLQNLKKLSNALGTTLSELMSFDSIRENR